MSERQEFIYFITGESMDVVVKSPFLERVTKKGFEVIYFTDPLDEYLVQQLPDFEGRKLTSVTKEGLKLGDEDQNKSKQEALEEDMKDLTLYLKKVYDEKIEKVIVSHRLTNSPCVVVTSQYGWSANMERIMKAQTFADASQQQWMKAKKTMEINPRHPLIRELKNRVAADASDKNLMDLAKLLLDSALLISGFAMENTPEVAARIMRAISLGLNVDPNASAEVDADDEGSSGSSGSTSSGSSGSSSRPSGKSAPSKPASDDDEDAGHDEL